MRLPRRGLVMGVGWPRLPVILLFVQFLAACAYNDHVENRVGTFDIAAERARDEMIFTNVIRASRAEPLAFLQLGQVTGVASAGGQLGLPSVVFGPPATTAATQVLQHQVVFGANAAQSGFASNYLQVTGSTTFNVTPSETKDFYLGLLTVVEPDTLAFFTEQGIAPEILFYLFTDKIIEDKAGKITEYRNDPLDPNFQKFQFYVDLAMKYGLSSEPVPGSKPASGKNQQSKDNGKDEDTGQPKTAWRLCFDRSHRAPGLPAAGDMPMCGSKVKLPNGRMVSFIDRRGERVKLEILPRSTFAIFQFLGRMVAGNSRIKLVSPDAIGNPPLADDDLFVVTTGAATGCFLDVSYEGRNYCVPQNATNTKLILSLLAQLLALNTSIHDIPITPQVQLVQ